MQKVICIGSACRDIFFPTSEGAVVATPEDLLSQKKITFELGAKYKVEDRYESLGGCAANVASGLARLGVDVACYSHTGDDSGADWIRDELIKNGVDTELITKEENCPSDLSAIVVDANSGDRVIFSNQKANSKLEIIAENLKATEWFFAGDLHGEWANDLDKIVKIAEENKINIAINPRQANIHDNVAKIVEVISSTDILFLNKDESIEVVAYFKKGASQEELNDEIFLLKALKEVGPTAVVLTDGVRGAWGYDGEQLLHIDAILGQPKDTTGAGDAFASGFLAAYLKTLSLEECLRWGIANSANSINFYGGVAGLLGEEKIIEQTKNITVKKLA